MRKKLAAVTVPDDQLALAIGRNGQNVRLASKLTGWEIDIVKTAKGRPRKSVSKDESSDDTNPETTADETVADPTTKTDS